MGGSTGNSSNSATSTAGFTTDTVFCVRETMRPRLLVAVLCALAGAVDVSGIKRLTQVHADGTFCVDLSLFVDNFSERSRGKDDAGAAQHLQHPTRPLACSRCRADPWQQPPEPVVEQMIASLAASGRVRCIMTYGARDGGAQVPKFAQRHGLKVIQGIWLTDDAEANTKETLAGEWLAKNFKDTVVAVSCGSEVMLRHHRGIADEVVSRCVRYLRGAGVTQPITHQAGWAEWCGECLCWWCMGARI